MIPLLIVGAVAIGLVAVTARAQAGKRKAEGDDGVDVGWFDWGGDGGSDGGCDGGGDGGGCD